jgi:hypothetical protein
VVPDPDSGLWASCALAADPEKSESRHLAGKVTVLLRGAESRGTEIDGGDTPCGPLRSTT